MFSNFCLFFLPVVLFSSLQIVLHAVESLLLLLKDCEENCRRLCREVGGTYFFGGGGGL